MEATLTLPTPDSGVSYTVGAAAFLQPQVDLDGYHVPASQAAYDVNTMTLSYAIGPTADRYVWTTGDDARSRGNSMAIDIANTSANPFTATLNGTWTYDLIVTGTSDADMAWVEGQIKGSPVLGELPFFKIQVNNGTKSGTVSYSFNITVPAGTTQSVWIDPTGEVAVPEPSTCLAGIGAFLLLLKTVVRKNRA